MSDDVARPPHTYSILVSPLELPEDKLTFSQKWLFYEGSQRLPVEHLAQLLDETSEFHKKNKNLYRSQKFLRAQQIMLLDRHDRREMPNLNDSAEVLRKHLSKAIRDGRTTPPDILALEDAARKQWEIHS
ncbi:hypothetical protein RhiJN_25759 [Ceratobasidium sp. AG-Ba]|nr:hypothetical protein RhiJN_25759 [Ceratobasidium sp. AG-Ba]